MAEPIPIVCDMTDAPDTPEERLAEYRALFASALVARERTETGIRFRLRGDILEQVRALAAKEKRCCGFFDFEITFDGDEVVWDVSVVDDPVAREILEDFYRLADGGTSFRVNVIQ
jgi:hypothetical protein